MEQDQTQSKYPARPFQTMDAGIVGLDLNALVDSVARHRGRIELMRDGEPACVLISQSELAGIEQALELLAEHPATAHLRQNIAEIAARDCAGFADQPRLDVVATLSAIANSQFSGADVRKAAYQS
jgi:PHD/YefM family antitoxin component YafN of YafNO toxin-antitoxin module